MNKSRKIILSITLIVICLGLSAFGMYKYNKIKAFNNLVNQGKQYMLQKDYDKAIQVYKEALSYKNDVDVKSSLTLAENLKNENSKKGIISKNIQLASEAAKNNKYDEANKYLDEVLKADPNNSEAKTLKDTYAKIVQEQQEKANAQSEAKKAKATATANTNKDDDYIHKSTQYIEKHGGVTYEQALQIVKEKYPGCSFKPAENVLSQQSINGVVPAELRKGKYIFYGYNENGEDLQSLILVTKQTGHISSVNPDGKVKK